MFVYKRLWHHFLSKFSSLRLVLFQNFVAEFSAVFTESAFEKEDCRELLNEIICEHFLRQGKLDIAEALNEVSLCQYLTEIFNFTPEVFLWYMKVLL